MAFDGIVTALICEELKSNIIGAKLNRIYMPTKNDLIFGLYINGKNLDLQISISYNNCRFHITNISKPNPFTPPNFCMLLRKHLLNSRLLQIQTFDLERVVCFIFEANNELNDKVIKKLYVEIMSGQSNVILVNENDAIIDSVKHISGNNIKREILPARVYALPENIKKSVLENSDSSDILVLLNQEEISYQETIIFFQNTFIGISKAFVGQIIR